MRSLLGAILKEEIGTRLGPSSVLNAPFDPGSMRVALLILRGSRANRLWSWSGDVLTLQSQRKGGEILRLWNKTAPNYEGIGESILIRPNLNLHQNQEKE